MLANLRSGLLLATSNRSEAAVGYATMDGDTSGGLSPIAGIDKALLASWLRWLEIIGPEGCTPFPALAAVNQQAPTAELRPPDRKPDRRGRPDALRAVGCHRRAAIRDKLTPLEVFQQMRPQFPKHAAAVRQWVERFFRLWCRNQWKRERYAPSFHLDDENLDPKTWCRFPDPLGRLRAQLAELRRCVVAL